MPEVEFYALTTDTKKIAGPPLEVICDDDQDAIELAKHSLDGQDLQVWQGARLVAALLGLRAERAGSRSLDGNQ